MCQGQRALILHGGTANQLVSLPVDTNRHLSLSFAYWLQFDNMSKNVKNVVLRLLMHDIVIRTVGLRLLLYKNGKNNNMIW